MVESLLFQKRLNMGKINMEHMPRTGDDADIAAVNAENDLQLALHRRKIDEHNSRIIANGFCYFCEAPLDDGQKFCPIDEDDFSCAHEYQRHEDAKKRNGKL